MAISKLSIVKFFELAITIVCVGLHEQTIGIEKDSYIVLLVAGTFVGYLIILIGLLAGYLLQTPINKRLDIFFSLIGAALFISSGALIIHNWDDRNLVQFVSSDKTKHMVLSKASLAIINGALFLVDVFLTVKD